MYRVVISGPAQRDLDEQHDWWAKHRSVEQAKRWYARIAKSIRRLAASPEKHALAPENGHWPFDVRQLTFGLGRRPTHRVLFRISGDEVIVLRSRHLAQAWLEQSGISG